MISKFIYRAGYAGKGEKRYGKYWVWIDPYMIGWFRDDA